MNRMQKISWMMVICIGTALILSVAAITILYFIFGFPVAWAGWGFMGITGFGGLPVYLDLAEAAGLSRSVDTHGLTPVAL